MRNKINLIDLDKTLIPFDSFRLLIKKEILKFNLIIFIVAVKRVLRIISLEEFKEKVIIQLDKKYDQSFFYEFAMTLFNEIDFEILNRIQKETNKDTYNILLSASPDIYVKLLIEKLEWMGSGSYFDDSGKFIHLHGEGKVNWLLKNFKKNEYMYNFAISDSSSDNKLLSLFKRKLKWTLQ